MNVSPARRSAVALLLLAWGCGGTADDPHPGASTQSRLFAELKSMCGRAFEGEATLVSGEGFEGRMVMHVRRCTTEPRATFTFDLSRAVEAPPAPWGYEGT